jgi:D-alanyl-D-alanine endopeptidase (penicillin-binding protein 7)
MQRFHLASGLLLGFALYTAVVPLASAVSRAAEDPKLRSNAFYVFDPADSRVLAARNESVPVPIASISKLMTALVVLDAGQPMNEKVTITRDDVAETARSGSRLARGVQLSRADMLHLALMSSENRAAHALCRTYPGGESACVRAMNEKAQSLGMTTAHFVEPTGLSSSNVSSPVDLAKLVQAASDNPVIREYSTDPEEVVYLGRRPAKFHNTNRLVDRSNWQVTVQKTGYISEAGRCLVMKAVIDGRDVIIVLLNSWGRLTRIGDANRVRDWIESGVPGS